MGIFSDLSFIVSLPTIAIVVILAILIFKVVVRTILKILFLIVLIILTLFFWSSIRPNLQNWINSEQVQKVRSEVNVPFITN